MEQDLLDTAARLLDQFTADQKPATAKQYRADLRRVAAFCGPRMGCEPSSKHLVAYLLSKPAADCEAMLAAYIAEPGPSAATVRRHVGSVQGVLKAARRAGLIRWRLDLDLPVVTPYSKSFGTSIETITRALNHLDADDGFQARRTALVIVLAHRLGLGTREMVALRYEHVNLDKHGLSTTLQKAPRKPEKAPRKDRTLDDEVRRRLDRFLLARGRGPGRLLCNRSGGVLDERALQRSLERLAAIIDASDLRVLPIRFAGIHGGYNEDRSIAAERARFSNAGYLPRFRSLPIGAPPDEN